MNKMASFLVVMSSVFIFISALIKGTLQIRVTTPESVVIPVGGKDMIPCDIDNDTSSYWAVYWEREYDGEFRTVVSRIDGKLSGAGLDSGDFNISEDNSLVVNYMELDYEATYQCQVLDNNYMDDTSTTKVIATVKPEAAPTITWDCDDQCISEQGTENFLNLTCTSDEAKPAVILTWLNDKGTPIETTPNDIQKGSLRGTFITTSTILYNAKRNNTLTCQAENDVIGRRNEEQRTEVKIYETVTPDTPAAITSSCVNICQSGLEFGTVINLTCSSGEARPPVKLTWLDSQGKPIEPFYNDIQMGSLTGTFVTSSTVQYNFTTNTTLICQAEMAGRRKTGLSITSIEVNEDGIGAIAHKGSFNAAATESDLENEEGADVVTILLVAVSVAVGVVIILGIIVAVLYKKNKEYIDAISYSYCLSKDGYILFARSQFAQNNQNAKL